MSCRWKRCWMCDPDRHFNEEILATELQIQLSLFRPNVASRHLRQICTLDLHSGQYVELEKNALPLGPALFARQSEMNADFLLFPWRKFIVDAVQTLSVDKGRDRRGCHTGNLLRFRFEDPKSPAKVYFQAGDLRSNQAQEARTFGR